MAVEEPSVLGHELMCCVQIDHAGILHRAGRPFLNISDIRCLPVATQRIWAPWRLAYVKDASKDKESACIFCAALEGGDDEASLIVHRGERCFVIMNKFPYTNGHLMVAPYDHVAALQELDADTVAELMALAQRGMTALETSYSPHGYNVGFNQGRVAGAGVEHHIHMHVVPRWGGDTNFMPVLGDTRVMNQTLEDSFQTVRGAFG
jgi:ATP adenylyltransferase